ncbi:hypothetical protein FJ251_13740 [bacterium]|nr:hypothetical protein [bacterium]
MSMKRILIGLGGLIVLLLIAAPLVIKAMFPEPKLRALVLPKAEAALGRSVDCGRIGLGLGLRGLTLELEHLELGADSTGYGLRKLDLPRLEARLALLPLLKREVAIKTLTFVEPGAELRLPPPGSATRAAKAAAGEAAATAAVAVAAPDLRLERARVHLVREGKQPLDIAALIESGRFASTLMPGGDLTLAGKLERAALSGKLADGRALAGQADLELDLAVTGGRLDLKRAALALSELVLGTERDTLQMRVASLRAEGKGAAPLSAFKATPPRLKDPGLDFGGTLRAENIALTQRVPAPLTVTIPSAEGPWALGAATQGAFALNGIAIAAGALDMKPPTGGSLTGELPAGRLDLSLLPGPTSTEVPRLALELAGYSLTSQPAAGPPVAIRGEGASLSGTASIPAQRGLPPRAELEIAVKPISVEGEALAKPLRIENTRLAGPLEALALKSLRLTAGGSTIAASGVIKGAPKAPHFDLQAQSAQIDVADFVVPAKEKPAAAGGAAGAASAPPVLIPMPGRLSFRIDRLVTPATPVTAITGRLEAAATGLRVEDVKGALAGGSLAGNYAMTPRADGAFDCKGAFSVTRVQAPAFLAALTPIKRGIEGSLTSQSDFSFTLKPGEKPQGLAMKAGVDLADGALVNLALLKSLAQLAGLPSKDRYGIGQLKHQFELRADRVLARDLRLPFEDGWITATGSAGLDGTLDFTGRWELGASTLARLGAGSTLAVLKNAKGKVELGFLVKGSAKEPAITLDTKSLEAQLSAQAKQQLQEKGSDLLKKGLDALKKK